MQPKKNCIHELNEQRVTKPSLKVKSSIRLVISSFSSPSSTFYFDVKDKTRSQSKQLSQIVRRNFSPSKGEFFS